MKKSNRSVVEDISGSWTDSLMIGDKVYWSLSYSECFKAIPCKQALPSDSRFREDVYWLAKGDLEKAQKWKDELEVKQRRDRRLRKEFAEKTGLDDPHSQYDRK